jgi:acetyl-CoA decarbonylase/synthase complex subunit delta
MMEVVAAVSYLMAGSDVAILRHPESVRLIRSFTGLMVDGGAATDIPDISKKLEMQEADLLSISPEPNLDFGGGETPAKEKPAKAPKKEAAKAAPKPAKKEAEPKKKEKKADAAPKAALKAALKTEEKVVELKPKKAEDTKANAEAEAKAKAAEEAKKKAETEAEAKAKAEAEAKAKAEAEAKVESEAKAEAKTKEKEELQALRLKRAVEREKAGAERKAMEGKKASKTPAAEQLDFVDKLIQNLNRIHKR